MTPTAHAITDAPAGPEARDPHRRTPEPSLLRHHYLTVLGYLFAFFSTVRVLGYLPTLWAVVQSGDSSQHSLMTWFTWAGANLTMAAWLYEQQGRRWNRAVAVNLVNTTMCVATFVVIWALRT